MRKKNPFLINLSKKANQFANKRNATFVWHNTIQLMFHEPGFERATCTHKEITFVCQRRMLPGREVVLAQQYCYLLCWK